MSAPVRPGDVLAGKYRVERVLGEGGMGVVVAAHHLQLGQSVALKFLLPEAVANPEALDRFMREARNAVRLKSEHVARILDVGTLDSGSPYIVMEYLEGSDLAGVLSQQGALPIPVAVEFVLQACDAIAEAHALGIIHRDLKPQNLFVTRRHDGTSLVKVLDFGISKSTAGNDFAATRSQAVMGSPAYMSPEQMRSAKFVDARTDVWALGVILYQLAVGHVPWDAETLTELYYKVATAPPPPFPGRQQTRFEAVVRRCLEKDPSRRFSSVHALAVALLPFAPAHAAPLVESIGRVLQGRESESPVPPPIAASGSGTLREASGQRMIRTLVGSRTRSIVGLVATVGALAGVAAIAVVLGVGRGGGAASESTSSPAAGHRATPSVAASASAPVASPPPPPPPAPQPLARVAPAPEPSTGTKHNPAPPARAVSPPARVAPAPGPSTGTRPHDQEPHRRTPIATPAQPITAAPAAKSPPTGKPPALASPAAPDPLSSPD